MYEGRAITTVQSSGHELTDGSLRPPKTNSSWQSNHGYIGEQSSQPLFQGLSRHGSTQYSGTPLNPFTNGPPTDRTNGVAALKEFFKQEKKNDGLSFCSDQNKEIVTTRSALRIRPPTERKSTIRITEMAEMTSEHNLVKAYANVQRRWDKKKRQFILRLSKITDLLFCSVNLLKRVRFSLPLL